MRERDGGAAAGYGFADLDRAVAALTREDDRLAVGGELHVVERVVAGDGNTRAAAFDGDELNGLVAAVLDGEEQALRIGRPGEAVDGAVDGIGRDGQLSVGAFEDHETPSVALISAARLGTVGEILAVGRILRRIVGAGIGGDFVRFAAFDGNDEEVVVGAGGGNVVGVHGEADFLAVGRNGVVVGTAERKGRDLASAGREVGSLAVGERDGEQVAAACCLPRWSSGDREVP